MSQPPVVTFDPPGKGQWVSLRDHFPRAVTPEYAQLLPAAMAEGEAIPFATYGLPVKTLMVGLVHGHVYVSPLPVVGKPSNSLPPTAALWAAARLVPALRRRERAARRALATRPWLAETAHWYDTERQEWVDGNLAIQDEDPDALTSTALAEHLLRAQRHLGAGYRRHFSLHGPDLIPSGLLLARCAEWGIAAHDVLPVLAGCSPASLGSGPTLDALRLAVQRLAVQRMAVQRLAVAGAGGAPRTIEDLRTVAPTELDAFLAEHGWRVVTGYDLDSMALIELPELVVTLACSPAASHEAGDHAASDHEEIADRLRARVPTGVVAELDQLISDARATFGMRDDNGGLTGAWPMGLLRRGMLAAGRQLTVAGALQEPDHAIEVTVDELVVLLRGGSVPSAEEVATRARERRRRSNLVPPLTLGPDVDIPLDALPRAMRAVSRAQLALRDSFTAPLDATGTARRDLEGEGIGTHSYSGRACVATDPADALTRLEPGDVLVAMGTTPAFNMALSIAGAVVVEEGGLLSHAAVIARELGLPALIGVAGSVDGIPDGAIVEVDPVAGQVRILAR